MFAGNVFQLVGSGGYYFILFEHINAGGIITNVRRKFLPFAYGNQLGGEIGSAQVRAGITASKTRINLQQHWPIFAHFDICICRPKHRKGLGYFNAQIYKFFIVDADRFIGFARPHSDFLLAEDTNGFEIAVAEDIVTVFFAGSKFLNQWLRAVLNANCNSLSLRQ